MLRLALSLLFRPETAGAVILPNRTIFMGTGVRCGGGQCSLTIIIMKVVYFLVSSAIIVSVILFLIGAFYTVLYAGKEDKVKTGKDIMIGSLIGLAIIYGSYAILRTLFYMLAIQ